MKIATVTIRGVTPYSQGRYHNTPKLEGELPDAYEFRTWQERLHVNQDGQVFIPPMCFKLALTNVAQYLAEKIPGKGNKTWTKPFTCGILVADPLLLPYRKGPKIPFHDVLVPSDGIRGSGKKVMKRFSLFTEWGGTLPIHILDDIITEQIFQRYITDAGRFIGIGVFRPERNGYFGRFDVEKIDWNGTARRR